MTALAPPAVTAPPVKPPPVTVSLPHLRGALSALAGVLPSRTTIPVLSHFWLRAYPNGVELVASDLDTTVAASVPVVAAGGTRSLFDAARDAPDRSAPLWEVLLPGRLLSDLVTRIGGSGPECRLVPLAPQLVRVITADGAANVVGADHAEFPIGSPFDVPPGETLVAGDQPDPPLTLPALSLALLLEQAAVAAASEKDVERPHLASVRLQAEEWAESGDWGRYIRAQAVDGNRVVSAEVAGVDAQRGDDRPVLTVDRRLAGPHGGVLVPLRAVRLLLPLLKRQPEGNTVVVDVLPADREAVPNLLQLRLPAVDKAGEECPELLLRMRLQIGQYPDLERYFDGRAPLEARVDSAALLYHVRVASLFAPTLSPSTTTDYAPVSITLDPGAPAEQALRLVCRNTDGEHRAWLRAEIDLSGQWPTLEPPAGGQERVPRPITLGLSIGFLLDLLQTAPGKALVLRAEAPLLPVRFRTDVDGYRALLMPMAGPTVAPDPGPPPPDWRPPPPPTAGEAPGAASPTGALV